ncbi:hypothetical protein IVA98_05715 [Bradyrhizobium sp. 160]|uniref:hypothetical protein n=1 Tax=Bradyrhizobium sp. 160 TaxID=2782634 RepID=UPI001FF8B334|nr:hypothetical protein [Bradyrhizobium sp. 160]MCK1622750.1 hypothetical protein [Bradyrhizobium sp. 160]
MIHPMKALCAASGALSSCIGMHSPKEQKKLFLDQAVMTGDRDETVQLEQQLQMFIEKRKLRE